MGFGAPSGTVTFLFTDIEGSTRLWEQHPEPMATALERHDTLMRSAIEGADGYIFKTVGDAFCAAFASAKEAVAAAGDAQRALNSERWPEDASLRVRMALHTGECEERDGDYFGPAVNRVARLEAITHGGQVVVSQATAVLVRDRLPLGMTLVDLGSHHLKDMDRPEEVFQLTVDSVPAAFPPLRSHPDAEDSVQVSNPTNLTEPLSSFVGRDVEMAEVVKLLDYNRLVTLTGSGGVGKTRLATEVGRSLLSDSPDGVWLVELATVSDPALVASEVLSDLGIGEQSGKDATETLVTVLSTQSRVIILDNCEQVIGECASIAAAVLRQCPEITLISTSREPLRVGGEVIYRVPSLSLPPEQVDDRTDLAGSGAVALFVERATAQAPGFELSDKDAPLVASICRRLDGMPLALELATARLRSMSLTKLHDRLEHRFGLLTGGSRVDLPRQQTLQALVDWSYDLLSEAEQALFRRVSVFVDGFDLEATEAVCAFDVIAEGEIADLLAALVDKSMVVAEPLGDDVRYRLQETLHEYGAERLAEAGTGEGGTSESEQVAAAHAEYYLSVAEQAAPHLEAHSYREWFIRLDTEELNLRAAIEHILATPEGANRVLLLFWCLRGYSTDARQPAQRIALLDRTIAQVGPDVAPGRRAEALYCKSILLSNVDRRVGLDTTTAALDLARQHGDRALEAEVLSWYSRGLAENGRHREALDAGAEAMALARQMDDPVLLGRVLSRYAVALDEAGHAGAENVYLEALALVGQSEDEYAALRLHNNYAILLMGQGNLADARRHLETALDLVGNQLTTESAAMYMNLGWVLLQESDPQRATSYFADALRTHRLNGHVRALPYMVLGLACCATYLGEFERAARLHGGADAWLSAGDAQWESLEEAIRTQDLVVLRERLGHDFEGHYESGRAMPPDEIVKLALTSY